MVTEFGSPRTNKAQRKGDPSRAALRLTAPYIYLPLPTFRLTVTDLVAPLLVPLMLKAYVPAGVFLEVEIVKTEFPAPVTEVGLNVAVAFAGKPLTLKVTTPLNPFCGLTVAVNVVLDPLLTVCAAGDGTMLKLPTVSVTDVLAVILPLVPVMVMT